MKRIAAVLLFVLIFSSTAFSQVNQSITSYDPSPYALHPYKLAGLVIRPPLALMSIFIKGGYWVLDSQPIRGAFDIEYDSSLRLDQDY